MDEREAANRSAREHLDRLSDRLAAGRDEIDRQHASIADTREHMAVIRRWLDESRGPGDTGADE
jgi:hypothetical protein